MTEDEARRLATRIIDTWPTGPRAYIWRDTLEGLDYELAVRAYHYLERDIVKGAPTPGQYHAAYRALERAINPPETTTAYIDEAISRSDYLHRLEERARLGDTQAGDELARWQRFTTTQVFAHD